ncbi:hypothetical protein [Neisseria bacilliformis]|uniref:hypothetical protein n=1 Tax=Neisseria bacilliformis TaxID=267212 RepID=UPI0028EB3F38|nr:hypothetical protein [Neisseria bacilliformis]
MALPRTRIPCPNRTTRARPNTGNRVRACGTHPTKTRRGRLKAQLRRSQTRKGSLKYNKHRPKPEKKAA